MRPQASWRGWLKVGEVSCAIGLYRATTDSERTSFHLVNVKTGNRVRQHLVDEVTGAVVDRSDVRKGFEVSPGEHVVLADEDLAALRIESTHLIEIERFVPVSDVDPIYAEDHFYVAPDDHVSGDAFGLLRDRMAVGVVAAIGRVAMGGRERLLVLAPRGNGILASTLRYPYEVRSEADVFEGIADHVSDERLDRLMDTLIASRTKRFRPEKFVDRYEEALVEFIRATRTGARTKRRKAAQGTLAASLKASLGRP